DWIVFPVPGKLVSMDKAARRTAGDDDPVQEVVAAAKTQAARRVPVGAAQVVESLLGIVGERIARLRLRPAEVERHAAGDAVTQGGGSSRRVAASGDRAQNEDSFRVDAVTRQEQIDAAPQVMDHPAQQAVAQELKLDAGIVTEEVVLPVDPVPFREVLGTVEWV